MATVSRYRVLLGKMGEDLACRELEHRGYAILARRYRCRRGELDIVARDGQTVVFVEVKIRSDQAFGGASQAVTRTKQRRMVRLASDYLTRHRLDGRPCRFDVVAIHIDNGNPFIEIFPNAFDARTT
jgi:putative endonuclease